MSEYWIQLDASLRNKNSNKNANNLGANMDLGIQNATDNTLGMGGGVGGGSSAAIDWNMNSSNMRGNRSVGGAHSSDLYAAYGSASSPAAGSSSTTQVVSQTIVNNQSVNTLSQYSPKKDDKQEGHPNTSGGSDPIPHGGGPIVPGM